MIVSKERVSKSMCCQVINLAFGFFGCMNFLNKSIVINKYSQTIRCDAEGGLLVTVHQGLVGWHRPWNCDFLHECVAKK